MFSGLFRNNKAYSGCIFRPDGTRQMVNPGSNQDMSKMLPPEQSGGGGGGGGGSGGRKGQVGVPDKAKIKFLNRKEQEKSFQWEQQKREMKVKYCWDYQRDACRYIHTNHISYLSISFFSHFSPLAFALPLLPLH